MKDIISYKLKYQQNKQGWFYSREYVFFVTNISSRKARPSFLRVFTYNREIKIHVYHKRQTSHSSGEFLRIENKQIETVPNDSSG